MGWVFAKPYEFWPYGQAFEPVYSIPLKIRPDLQSRNIADHQTKVKKLFESYDEAYLTAAIDSEEYCKPFWVYQNADDGHYSISTRGFKNANALQAFRAIIALISLR